MALSIKIASYISGGYVNPVIWRLYEVGTGALVDEHQEMGPHGVVYNFSFNTNIRDIVYRISLFEQPGGTGIGVLIKAHEVTPTTSTIVFDADIETIVDGGEPEDPVSGTSTSPIIAELIGKDYYVVQRSIGQRRAERVPEITINVDGSYTLATVGETFFPEDTWIIKIRPTFVINPLGSQAGPNYKDVVLITADTTLTNLDMGKLLIVDGSLPVLTLQLPVIADLSEKVTLSVLSVGTNNINVVIKAATGETISSTGSASNTFILSRSTEAQLIKLGSILYGSTDDTDVKRRGQIEWGYSVGLNRIWADRSEYLVADYPGLKKAMDDMQVGTIATYAQATSSDYNGYYAISLDGLNFKVPDLRNRFVRALNGTGTDTERVTQGPGGYQEMQLQAHTHTYTKTISGNSYGDNSTDQADQTATTSSTGGIETRPKNIGLIPLIII
ncbi:MAG: hypothetical protein V4560_14810 [Bacteroidota bacterium]